MYLITVAIVCLNEEKNIADCIGSLVNQNYRQGYEILVVDNNSTDQTRQIVASLQKKHNNIRLVINKKKGIAASRNIAVKESKTNFLAFTDADCVAPKNWLSNLIKGYQKYSAKDEKIVAVGGSNIPPPTTDYYRALSIMLDSFLGSRGSVQGRIFPKDRPVSHLPCVNVLFNRGKLIEVGGFDEALGSIIEDEDMTYRLAKKGYKFYYLANSAVIHKMRSNISSWAKNMFTYGKGRAWFIKKHPEKIHPYFLVPVILVLTFPVSLPIYLFFMLLYAINISAKKQQSRLFFRVFCLLVTTHLCYGLGEIWGTIRTVNSKSKAQNTK